MLDRVEMLPKVFAAIALCTTSALIVFLSGCNPYQVRDSSPTPVRQIPTVVSYASETLPSVTTEPTVSLSTASLTVIPRLTPSVPTWTPRPTLSPESAQALIIELLSNNGGCRFPCWWGITPGVTTWQEARNFLETMSPRIIVLRQNLYGITYKNLPQSVSNGAVGATIFVTQDVVESIRTDIYYPLEQILQKYDRPNEIWVFVDRQTINREIPFTIALFYQDQGFLVVYEGTADKENKVWICSDRIGGDQLAWFLWNPSLQMSFAEVGKKALLFVDEPSERPFRLLQDASNLDVESFYQTYVHPDNSDSCFEFFDNQTLP